MFVSSPDGLLSLGLADLWLLVPLGHDLGQGGPSDGPLELHCTTGTLLCDLFLLTHYDKNQHYHHALLLFTEPPEKDST